MPTHTHTPPTHHRRGAVDLTNNPSRRGAVDFSKNHKEVLNHKAKWAQLPSVQLQSGDVLIKHIWGPEDGGESRGATELMIRVGGMANIFDSLGSQSAEHAALVGNVGKEVRIFEAEGEGIRTKSGDALAKLTRETAYSVFRCVRGPEAARQGMQVLCDGMATRLNQIETGKLMPAVSMSRYPQVPEENKLREAAAKAHEPCKIKGVAKKQTALYSWARLTSPAFPTVIPDSCYSKHNEKVLSFIRGERESIRYICSGFAATMLHAWYITYYNKRVFTDSSTVHPTALEHHLMKGTLQGFERVGRYGDAGGHGSSVFEPLAKVVLAAGSPGNLLQAGINALRRGA